MDEKEAQVDGQFQGQDIDFGVFNPMANLNGQFSDYSTWTQFSGFQPPANDPASFSWDSFVTPPSSPSSGVDFDLQNPNFFTNLNSVMQGMGRISPSDYEADSRNADNATLASTPVAQSLLEALSSSNPLLSTMPEANIPLQEQFDFQDASVDGFEMYAEALNKLGSSCGSYNPFGTSDVLNSSSSTPTKELDQQFAANNLKPSYSEVAKTLKNIQNGGKEKDDSDLLKKRSTDSTTSKSFKGSKKFVPRPIRGRNNSVPDDLRPTTVSPDSKYGLDDFGDVCGGKGEKDDCSLGLNGSPLLARKNSTSSISSGTSGIEEIHLTKSSNIFGNTSEGTPSIEKISMNKDKEKAFDDKIHNTKEEKPFFDARRIFQSKDTNKRRGGQSKLQDDECGPTILNNGKPSYAAWCSTNAPKKSTHYINNNLRDSQKKTNQNPSGSQKAPAPENVYTQSNEQPDKMRIRSSSSKSDISTSSSTKPNMPLQTAFDQELIDEWLSFLFDKAKLCMHQLWTLVLMVILLIFSIIVYLVSSCVHILSWIWGKVLTLLETKLFKGKLFGDQKWKKGTPEAPKKIGIEENITLPSTGDEAMQRLLACKGKDPYSILGLKATATDDDIKKYYRRQAVLVHPDKNQQPGAEEAFKILGHAFDHIGDAAKRQAYDRQLQEASEAEAAMGDVWAETSMLGFLWHYYACMEGKVFDITEWVACKKDFFKHMQANAHHVFYRIATEGNRGHHGKSNGGTGPPGAGAEPDLEDFISHLFHQAMNTESNGANSQSSWQQPSQPNGQPWNPPSSGGGGQPSAAPGKRNRRRKKKH